MEPKLEQKLSQESIKKLLLDETTRESLEPKDSIRKMIPNRYLINGKSVYYIAASHIFNASEEDKPRLKEELSSLIVEFQEKTKDKKKIVYIFEGQRPDDTRFESMQDYESVRLIEQVKISQPSAELISGEPKINTTLDYIKESNDFQELNTSVSIEGLGTFNKADLSLLYFYFRGGVPSKSEIKVQNLAQTISAFENFNFFDVSVFKQQMELYSSNKISLEDAIKTCMDSKIFEQLDKVQNYFHERYPELSISQISDTQDPYNKENFSESLKRGLNSIAVIVSQFRDITLLNHIQQQTALGSEVFVLFGRSHHIRSQKVLEAMSESK